MSRYAAEEAGLWGSQAIARYKKEQGAHIGAMMEFVGVRSERSNFHQFLTDDRIWRLMLHGTKPKKLRLFQLRRMKHLPIGRLTSVKNTYLFRPKFTSYNRMSLIMKSGMFWQLTEQWCRVWLYELYPAWIPVCVCLWGEPFGRRLWSMGSWGERHNGRWYWAWLLLSRCKSCFNPFLPVLILGSTWLDFRSSRLHSR